MIQLKLVTVERDRFRLGALGERDASDLDLRKPAEDAVPRFDRRRRITRGERLGHRFVVLVPVVDAEGAQRLDERALRLAQRHPILGAARAGE